MFTRYFSPGRKILLSSLSLGLVIAVLSGSIQFTIFHHKRAQQFDTVIFDLQNYLNNYFSELLTTIDKLQPMTMSECPDVATELTSRAAFSIYVRAFLLIKDNRAFCSSATGPMDVPLRQLIPHIDLHKKIDMVILPGTPMMPDKPALALWIRNPLLEHRGVFTSINASLLPWILYASRQNSFRGAAITIHNKAISTFSNRLVNVNELPPTPVRSAQIAGLPITVSVYGDQWAPENLQFSLLMGLMCGMLSGLLCFYLLSVRLRPGKEILSAIKRNQFYVVYQPVVDAGSLKIRGVEVLMRWRHPTAGEIPPDAFISFAEAQHLIVPLTRHLFKLISADAPTLQQLLPPGAKLGVNIAPTHMQSSGFRQDLRDFSGIMPANYFQVVLEITERAMLDQREGSMLFEWLHHKGFEIAIDDFGTGHSALIYLEHFAFDYLKIDRGFINAIGTETITSPVLDAVLTLAQRMSLVTVAEGVETQEQATWLRQHGVSFLQGYWISRPLTLEKLVSARNEKANYFTTT